MPRFKTWGVPTTRGVKDTHFAGVQRQDGTASPPRDRAGYKNMRALASGPTAFVRPQRTFRTGILMQNFCWFAPLRGPPRAPGRRCRRRGPGPDLGRGRHLCCRASPAARPPAAPRPRRQSSPGGTVGWVGLWVVGWVRLAWYGLWTSLVRFGLVWLVVQ